MYPQNSTASGGSKPSCASKSENDAPNWEAGAKVHVRAAAEMRKAAEDYARKGFKIFPVWHVRESGQCACGGVSCKSTGKHPVTRDGYKAASADVKTVRDWWIEHPHSNIGLPCDANNLAVLDVDPRNGGLEGIAELESVHGPITSAVEAVSGGAGRHIIYALDADNPLELRGKAGTGIDLKTKGYILAEPSNHASGGTYRWAEGKAISDATPTPLPAWVAELKASSGGKSSGSGPTGNGVDPDFDAREASAFKAIETGGPQPEEIAEAEALRDALAAERPDFATFWETGDAPKLKDKSASGRRAALASRMLHHLGGTVYTARHHHALRLLWEFGGGDTDSRQAAREWAWAYQPSKIEAEGDVGAADDTPDALDVQAVKDELEAVRLHEIMDPDLTEARSKVVALSHVFDAASLHVEASRLRKVDLSDSSAMAALDALVAPFTTEPGSVPLKAPASKAEKPAPKPETDKARFLSQIMARPLPTVSQIVKGVLTAGEIVIAAGAPGAGKSADLMHLGLCVATGRPFHGRPTKLSGVLFIGSENPAEDVRRMHANIKRHGFDLEAPFLHEAECATLWTEDGKPTKHEAGIIELARHIEAKRGVPCRLIVIDNLRRIISPGSANDEAHATTVLKALERIRNATGATVVCIHHTIRDGSRFAGSGAIESHADSVWRFSPPAQKAKGAPSTIAFDKLRLGDKRQVLEYRFGFEVVAHDDDGDEIRTVVVLDASSGRQTGATEADFGAVDETEGTPSLDGWPKDGEASDGPERPAAPAGKNAVEDAPDVRLAVVLEIVRELGAGGVKFTRREVEERVNARQRKRKVPQLGRTVLCELVADMVEDGSLVQVGTGRATAYGLPELAAV